MAPKNVPPIFITSVQTFARQTFAKTGIRILFIM